MQLNVTGHHVDVTSSLKGYVEKKLDRIVRHSDHVIDVHCILTVEKLRHKAEATVLLRGGTVYADAVEQDMYAAIDTLADKLDRRVKKHKEKLSDHHAIEAQKTRPEWYDKYKDALSTNPQLDVRARFENPKATVTIIDDEVVIQFKDSTVPVHTYYFDLHPRDLDDPQFEWSFQRQLYDALHDYFVEMFIRTPQDHADRRRKGL